MSLNSPVYLSASEPDQQTRPPCASGFSPADPENRWMETDGMIVTERQTRERETGGLSQHAFSLVESDSGP